MQNPKESGLKFIDFLVNLIGIFKTSFHRDIHRPRDSLCVDVGGIGTHISHPQRWLIQQLLKDCIKHLEKTSFDQKGREFS